MADHEPNIDVVVLPPPTVMTLVEACVIISRLHPNMDGLEAMVAILEGHAAVLRQFLQDFSKVTQVCPPAELSAARSSYQHLNYHLVCAVLSPESEISQLLCETEYEIRRQLLHQEFEAMLVFARH